MDLRKFKEMISDTKGNISAKLADTKEKLVSRSDKLRNVEDSDKKVGKVNENDVDEKIFNSKIPEIGIFDDTDDSYEPLSFEKPIYSDETSHEKDRNKIGRSRNVKSSSNKADSIYDEYNEPDYYAFYRKYKRNMGSEVGGNGGNDGYGDGSGYGNDDYGDGSGYDNDGYGGGYGNGGYGDGDGYGNSGIGGYGNGGYGDGSGYGNGGYGDGSGYGEYGDDRYYGQADGNYGLYSDGSGGSYSWDYRSNNRSNNGRSRSLYNGEGASRGGHYDSVAGKLGGGIASGLDKLHAKFNGGKKNSGGSRDLGGSRNFGGPRNSSSSWDSSGARNSGGTRISRNARYSRKSSKRNASSSRRKVTVVAAILVVLMLFIAGKSATESIKKTAAAKSEREEYIAAAREIAMSYDYDGAIAKLEEIKDYSKHSDVTDLIKQYTVLKASLVPFTSDDVVHVFYHSLVVDPELAFNGQDSDGFKQWMTTVTEFNDITQEMYENGYILVDVHDFVEETTDSSGEKHFKQKEVYLPADKKPYVLSLDDLSYYHSYDNKGIASKLVLDENGEVTCEYKQQDGTVVTGAYDCVPLLDQFLDEHPDATYKGARGIIALTGYNGIFGYRTDESYETKEDIDKDKQEWLDEHPDFDLDTERKEAKKIAKALKKEGWTFASHTWGHQKVGNISLASLEEDNEKWMKNVEPLIGETDTIIFAHGSDLANNVESYPESEKFQYLKEQGFDYYMNVYSKETYTMKICDTFVHQGRINLDGYRLWQDAYGGKNYLGKLFDAADVIDPVRKDMPAL